MKVNGKSAWERFEKTGRIEDYLNYIGVYEFKSSNIYTESFSVKDGSNADKNTGICPKAAEYR